MKRATLLREVSHDPRPGFQPGRHGLWSLFAMIRFFADSFVTAFLELEFLQSAALAITSEDNPSHEATKQQWRDAVCERSKAMATECQRTGFQRLNERCLRIADKATVIPIEPILYLLRDLLQDIQSELGGHLYFWVPGDRKDWYADSDAALYGQGRPFPEVIFTALGDAAAELAEASRCFALARWTACVFHVMRATELALQKWADDLGVTLTVPISEAGWEEILKKADDQIEALQRQQRTSERSVDIATLADARSQFRNINQAWRRHVAHARDFYDERRAREIMSHVQAFMERVAERASA